ETYGSSNRMADQTDVADADVVVGLDVLEHIADDRSFLRSVVERCVEGTTLVFTAPAMPWLWSSWDVNLGHHRRYTRASFESLLSMPELDVREVSYLFPELIVPALARRLVRRNRTGSAEFPKLPPSVDRLAYLV